MDAQSKHASPLPRSWRGAGFNEPVLCGGMRTAVTNR